MNVDNTKEFRCLSLCSGYGGLELGLKRAIENLRTVAYVEVEAFACANLVSKMEKGLLDAAPIWTDIKTFNGWPFRKNIHIITADYPCQGESHAGKRQGQDDPRWLWPYIERIIEAVRPVWFFGENVEGHLTLGFPTVYRSLHNLGYTVEAGLFTAAECGAPHRRKRLFILAYNEAGRFTRSYLSVRQSQRQEQTSSNTLRISEMADTTTQRIQRPESKGAAQAGRQIDEQSIKWPARPGQPQYEWEEPRVVGYAPRKRLPKRTRRQMGGQGKSQSELERPSGRNKNGQTQSQLGLSTNGTSCGMGKSRSRIDELRLLGNGVVPQQAEKAFRYLIDKFR